MGYKSGDNRIMKAPLDWIGFHYWRRIVSNAGDLARSGGSFGTEIEQDTGGGRDPYTRFNAVMPTEGPLTDAGLEVWPRGIYDLVIQITREYSRPIIEITESGCSYLDSPYEKENGRVPDTRRISFFRNELAELARAIADGANVRLLSRLEPARQLRMGRRLQPTLRPKLRRFPRPETHYERLG